MVTSASATPGQFDVAPAAAIAGCGILWCGFQRHGRHEAEEPAMKVGLLVFTANNR